MTKALRRRTVVTPLALAPVSLEPKPLLVPRLPYVAILSETKKERTER